MPLTVIATLVAKPDSADVLEEGLTDLAGKARQEDGCLSYDLFQSAADPAVFMTVELWESQAHLDAHLSSPDLTKAAETFGPIMAKPFEVVPLNPVEV